MSDSLIPSGDTSTETATTETTTEAPVTTQETTTQETTTTESTEVKPTFLFADGVAGEGDTPEWFKTDKYKTVSDQAKGYSELEKRFGSFTGAPKDGKYEVNDANGEAIDFETNPLMKLTAEWGAENQLSTEGLQGLVERVGQLANQQIEEDQTTAKAALGENADKRLADLSQWGKNNLDTEEFIQFQGLAQNAGQVEILEKMIGMAKNSKLVDKNAVDTPNAEDAKAELEKMQLATNEKGQRLMDVDLAYRAKVNAKMKEFYRN
jgi:hypothetical protein